MSGRPETVAATAAAAIRRLYPRRDECAARALKIV